MDNKKLIDKYWDILKGKCINEESMDMAELPNIMRNNMACIIGGYNGFWVLKFAYNQLVKLGEIDQSIMFNLSTADYMGMQDESGDLGFKDNVLHRYSGHNWQKI